MGRLLLALCFFLGACEHRLEVLPEPTKEPTHERYLRLTKATVQVHTHCSGGNSTGSGVLIDWTTVATANHVVDEGCTYKIHGSEWKVIARDEPGDIALLQGVTYAGEPVELETDPYLGEALIAIGYPHQPLTGDTQLQITTGVLSAKYADRYKISAPIYFGSSGGPVFTQEGKLLGLSVSLMTRGGNPMPGEWFATPAYRIQRLSRRFTKNFSVAELACKCGVPVPRKYYPNALEIVERAEKLRASVGHPLLVVSGFRTPDHNTEVGGAPESYHLTASALDLRSARVPAHELAAVYEALIASGKVPDGGLGVYADHIHIDLGPARRWSGQ